MADKDLLEDAREAFKECEDAEGENRSAAIDDLRFARLGEQWPEQIRKQREAEGRICLTINKLPTFVRQVVNEVRLNRPSIRCKPVGNGADQVTARVLDGLIRNIEVTSQAEVAYDTAADFAASCGFGYFRVDIDYASDDTFEMDLLVGRINNPFTVFGDPRSTAADSSDWNVAFVTEMVSKEAVKQKYGKALEVLSFEGDGRDAEGWVGQDDVRIAEWWTREETIRPIVRLSDGSVLAADVFEKNRMLFDPAGITVVGTREVRSHKVRQRLITAGDIIEDNEWSGRYIPIVPCYGEEINVEGRRVFKSLIRDAKDAQKMFNFWRSASTELVALSPRVPFLVPEDSIPADEQKKWETANTKSHAFLRYRGQVPPTRMPLDAGAAVGAMSEALAASDDLKAITGIYDASLGARSNETSGRAIMARQREGDVGTFAFIDNLSRAVRHAGRILVDLIPSVYNSERVIRTLQEDGTTIMVPLKRPVVPQMRPGEPNPIGYQPVPQGAQAPQGSHIFDLAAGKYDVVVEAGPSFTTKREEASQAIIELIRANPAVAPLVADVLAKNQDWPDSEKIAERLRMTLPPHIRGEGPPPEVMQMQQQMRQMGQNMQQMGAQMQKMQADLMSAGVEGQKKDLSVAQKDIEVKQAKLQASEQKLEADVAKAQLQMIEQMQAQQAQSGQEHAAAMQQIMQAIAQQQQAIEQVAQVAEQTMAVASKPRAKRGTAVKLSDGRWALEAVEESQPTIQ